MSKCPLCHKEYPVIKEPHWTGKAWEYWKIYVIMAYETDINADFKEIDKTDFYMCDNCFKNLFIPWYKEVSIKNKIQPFPANFIKDLRSEWLEDHDIRKDYHSDGTVSCQLCPKEESEIIIRNILCTECGKISEKVIIKKIDEYNFRSKYICNNCKISNSKVTK